MPRIDWIIIVLLIIFCILGMLFGFGRGLRFFTGGIIGIIISIFVCYALGGLIINIGFVQDAMNSFRDALAAKNNGFCNILLKIHIDIAVYYVVLFLFVTVMRIITVRFICGLFELDNIAFIIINKILGVLLFVGVFVMVTLLVFWVIALVGGGTAANISEQVAQSKIGLSRLYNNNPFMSIIDLIRFRVSKAP